MAGGSLPLVELQHRHKGFLRDFDRADHFHSAFLALLLLFEKFSFSSHIAAIALGQDILSERLHVCAGDDFAADSRLDGHGEHLAGNKLFQFRSQRTPIASSLAAVSDQ